MRKNSPEVLALQGRIEGWLSYIPTIPKTIDKILLHPDDFQRANTLTGGTMRYASLPIRFLQQRMTFAKLVKREAPVSNA